MRKFLQRLRGVIGMGLTWAVGWAGITVATGLLGGLPFQFAGSLLLGGLFQGFIAGSGFAVILSIAERRHTLGDLSLKRVALWGGLGATALRLLGLPFILSVGIPFPYLLGPIVMDALMGAGFASGAVALARRGDEKMIEGGGETALLEG